MEDLSHHLSFHTLRSARKDITNLLKSFQARNSLRFSVFCEVWKEAKFSLIFCGRNSIPELTELIEEIFHMTKEYLVPAYEVAIRVGALYTLYGLYFKQPLKDPVKIRLIKPEWDALCKLIEQCKQEHSDVVLIHLKLFTYQAYIYTAVAREVGFEIGFRKYFRKKNMSLITSSSLPNSIEKPLVEPGLIDNLSKLVSTYCQLKTEAVNERDPNVIRNNFVEILKKKCEDFGKKNVESNKNQESTNSKNNENRGSESNDDVIRDPDFAKQVPEKPIGRRRKKSKKRAFSSPEKKIEDVVKHEVIDSPPPKKRKASLKQMIIAKRKAQKLMEEKGLFDIPGPSTSTSSYDDMALPEL